MNPLLDIDTQDKLAAAVAHCREQLAADASNAEAHRNLGVMLMLLGQHAEAEQHSRMSLALNASDLSALNNLGTALAAQGRLSEAAQCFSASLQQIPGVPLVLGNLGCTLLLQGHMAEAVACFRQAVAASPGIPATQSNLLFALSMDPACSSAQYLAEACQYGRQMSAAASAPFREWQLPYDPRDPGDGKPMRVGLVSGNLRNHPVGYFLESVLAQLDPARVQVIVYATTPQSDALTDRVRPLVAQWAPVFGLNDQALAQQIHADQVHVLLDLDGHTEGNRLPMFAWRPAPVQASWLGYWASTGMPEMDFVLADPTSVPPQHSGQFIERLQVLPDTRLCFSPPQPTPPLSPLPARANGFVTFGSFQTLNKVHDGVLALWGLVLKAVPRSRLRLASKQVIDGNLPALLTQRLLTAGIDPGRVTLAGPLSREAYLESYSEVDLVLDTFPCSGGTTTCEALWMGVPTLTLSGDTLLARQGESLLRQVGLTDWIAGNAADYVARAAALAADLDHLAQLRAGLREHLRTTPLLNATAFARQLETALAAMWAQKCPLPGRSGLPGLPTPVTSTPSRPCPAPLLL